MKAQCATRERNQAMKDGGFWRDIERLGTDSMDAIMAQLRCSKQGRLDYAATQKRSSGDHKNMSARLLLMKKIDTSMDKYEGKVVPQVQVLEVNKFDFGEW